MTMSNEELARMVQSHEAAIHGNGRPGLVETMAGLRTAFEGVQRVLERLAESSEETREQVTTMVATDAIARERITESLGELRQAQASLAEQFTTKLEEVSTETREEIETLAKRIEPLESFNRKYVWVSVVASGTTFVFGAVLVFIFEHWDRLAKLFN